MLGQGDFVPGLEVASPPIRPRILKAAGVPNSAASATSCIASDPTEDTERSSNTPVSNRIVDSCIASDPTEDTESAASRGLAPWPIRCCTASDPTEDTESHLEWYELQLDRQIVASPPIRPRILKGYLTRGREVADIVASPPIRPRIQDKPLADSRQP